MIEPKNGYVPIEYASTRTVQFVTPLPDYISGEDIGVNPRRLERLCRLGGINNLTVIGRVTGNIDHDPFTTSTAEIDSVALPASSRWVDGIINLNNNGIAEHIRREERWEAGANSTEAWAHHLDNYLREGVAHIGVNNLIKGMEKREWGICLFIYGMTMFTASREPNILSALLLMGLVPTILNLRHSISYRGKHRLSLVYGPQLDRALVLKVLSKTTQVAKDFSEDSNWR